MRIKFNLFIVTLCFSVSMVNAQTKATVAFFEHLCSKDLWGRGYIKAGMPKAANYLASRFEQLGLKPLFADKFQQTFYLAANTFPGKVKLRLNGKLLVPGADYLVKANSAGIRGRFFLESSGQNLYTTKSKGLQILAKQKMLWTPSRSQDTQTTILLKDSLMGTKHKIKISLQQKWVPSFEVSNVGASIRGTEFPDSFIFFTAHYDHLGGMGKKVYFPGANDNASGTALLYELAQHYVINPTRYSLVFLAFAAEEIGLEGSKYFVANPSIDLNKIKLVVNLDLMGNGADGITVVNATKEKDIYQQLLAINEKQKLFKVINARDNAANSDHYPFTQKGVSAIFIYSLGKHNAYHDIYDQAKTEMLHYFPSYLKLLDPLVR